MAAAAAALTAAATFFVPLAAAPAQAMKPTTEAGRSGALPAAPEPCHATRNADGSYHITWTRPDSATPVWRYSVQVWGQRNPYVKLGERRADGENPARSYTWTGPVDGGRQPLTFQVRGNNDAGHGEWCRTQVTGDTEATGTQTTEPPPADTTEPPPADTTEPPSSSEPRTSGLLPYTADSYFKSEATGPVDEGSTDAFHSFMRSHPEQGGAGIDWPKINMSENWAMSYAVSGASDPVWHLTGGNTDNSRLAVVATGGAGFHMPDSVAKSFPTGAQDRPGVIIDTASGFTVQFADAEPNLANHTIHVSNAGIMWHSSNGLDYRNPRSDDDRNFTSRGRILDAMVIRRDVLDRAIADGTGLGHVLHLYFVETDSAAGFEHPMVGAEGGESGFGAEGLRIRIKPTVDLKARGLSGACLAVARTLKDNGAYLGDNSGSATQIKASQASHYQGTNLATDCMRGKVSWDDFQVLQ